MKKVTRHPMSVQKVSTKFPTFDENDATSTVPSPQAPKPTDVSPAPSVADSKVMLVQDEVEDAPNSASVVETTSPDAPDEDAPTSAKNNDDIQILDAEDDEEDDEDDDDEEADGDETDEEVVNLLEPSDDGVVLVPVWPETSMHKARMASIRAAHSAALKDRSAEQMREDVILGIRDALGESLPDEASTPAGPIDIRAMHAMALFDRGAVRWKFALGRAIQRCIKDMERIETSISSVLSDAHAIVDALEHVVSDHNDALEHRLQCQTRRQRGRDIVRHNMNMALDSLKRRVSERIRGLIDDNLPWDEEEGEMDDCHQVREVVVKITDPKLLDNIITSMRTRQQSVMRSEIQSWMSALEDHLNHRRLHSTSQDIIFVPRGAL